MIARLTDRGAAWALLLDPDLRTGELYTDGRLVLDAGDVLDFLSLILRHGDDVRPSRFVRAVDRLRTATQLWGQRNDPRRAQRNVAHHYDLGDALYALFLDPDWQYSCAYFEHSRPEPGRRPAGQEATHRGQLRLGPGMKVLDIGCGWGGLAIYLARTAGAAEVLGVTLSTEQIPCALADAPKRSASTTGSALR